MSVRFLLVVIVCFSPYVFCQEFEKDFVLAAIERTHHTVRYDGTYFSIPYLNFQISGSLQYG